MCQPIENDELAGQLRASCGPRHFELNFVDPQKVLFSELAIVTNVLKTHKSITVFQIGGDCDTNDRFL